MSAEIAMQKALRARLVSTQAVIALVPATSILDRNERPDPSPSIILGEIVSRDRGDSLDRALTACFSDLHIWKREPSTAGAKEIAGAIGAALKGARLQLDEGYRCIDAFVSRTRCFRDPDGLTSHAVVTVESIIEEF